jgi:low affinity Fe/Cu permease
MSNSVWTWFIIGITAIAIIALLVSYFSQNKTDSYKNNE